MLISVAFSIILRFSLSLSLSKLEMIMCDPNPCVYKMSSFMILFMQFPCTCLTGYRSVVKNIIIIVYNRHKCLNVDHLLTYCKYALPVT